MIPQDLTVLAESPQQVRTDFDGDDFPTVARLVDDFHCHGVALTGSTGARRDCSAEGTYVARGIDSAHSEVVGGTP